MPSLFAAQNPTGAAVGWSQACGFWRTNAQTCRDTMIIGWSGFITRTAIDGAWITGGKIGNPASCPGSDTYVTCLNNAQIGVDVWKALADGIWSSSCVFSFYGHDGGSVSAGTAYAKPASASSPAQISKAVSTVAGASCPTGLLATVTVFDDGTYSIV